MLTTWRYHSTEEISDDKLIILWRSSCKLFTLQNLLFKMILAQFVSLGDVRLINVRTSNLPTFVLVLMITPIFQCEIGTCLIILDVFWNFAIIMLDNLKYRIKFWMTPPIIDLVLLMTLG